MEVITSSTLFPLGLVFSVFGSFGWAIYQAAKLQTVVDVNEEALKKHQKDQDEKNKEIIKRLNGLSEDMAVIKRLLKDR
jgi:hypothetical protein